MEDAKLRTAVKRSIQKLLQKDYWLLEHDLSERSISHKLAEYIQLKFAHYHVDCEYNGDVSRPAGRKRADMLKAHVQMIDELTEKEEAEQHKDYVSRQVFPDIIIHRRGDNDNNLCIVEIKKDTSGETSDYDYLKMRAYTGNEFDNTLQYQLGIFVRFITGNKPGYQILFFKDGHQEI